MSLQKATYGFVPTSITGCQLWLDGADPAGNGVIPSAGNLSTWTDKSGKSNSPTSSSGTYPTYSPSSKCVTWTGGGTQLTFPTSLHPAVVGTAFTVFFVEQRTTGSENFIIRGTSLGTNLNLLIGHGGASAATAWRFAFYGNDLDYTGLPSYSASEPATVSCFMYSKPNRAIYHNGSVSANASDTNASDLTSWTGAMIGGNSTWPGYSGNVFEMLIYSTSLTLTQRQQVEGYLAQKFGLSGYLPAGHPGLTTSIYRTDYIKNSAIIRNSARPIPYFAAFSPRQIPGCSLWMDGADSSTMTTASGYISAWTSKGTNALSFTQATSSKQPLLVANVYNGYSVVRCINPGDPVVNVNIATVNNAVLQTGASFCIFIVHNPTIANGSPFCFQNGGGNRISCHLTENGNVVFDTPNVRLTYAAPGNYLTSGLKLDVFWSVANAINYRASGSATASASAGASSWTDGTLTFGSFTPTQASYYYQTDIGEIIWFNTALALTQVQQVESYLAQKWGLTASLPGGHLHSTQRAGAITTVANTKFSMVGVRRAITATGGTVTTSGGFRIHTFTSVGSTNFIVTNGGTAQVLVVSGGGAGGGNVGGGGGAGGAVFNSAFSLSAGTYSVTVGNGGAIDSGTNQGQNGGSSSFSNITVIGGGAGGVYGGYAGLAGACGGGAGNNFTFGIGSVGFNGGATSGICGGGGGGMGSSGTAGSGYNGGAGGAGATYTIGGQSYTVCGGGGGAGYNVAGTNGVGGSGGSGGGATGTTVDNNAGGTNSATPNSGGGGAGGTNNGNDYASAGASGIVIIAYTI